VRRYDGTYRWFLTRALPIVDSKGKVVQWIGTNTDIDEQKQNEALLEEKVKERTRELTEQRNLVDNILSNSSNGISVTEMIRDENGRVIDADTILANDAAVRYTGLPRDIYLGKTAREIDPNILASEYGQTCLRTLETGEPSIIQYYLEMTKRWLELTISRMDENHLIHIFTDVTPVKQAQLALEKTVEDLQRSNTNLEEFAYAASHDLKEPIRKINVFTDRLKRKLVNQLGPEELHLFDRMEIAAQRMSSLIEDLLTYSQVSLGAKLNEEVDLNRILQVVLDDLDLDIEQKNAKIVVEDLATVKGHPRQLEQAFHNLISNSLKYAQPGIAPEILITGKTVGQKDIDIKTDLHQNKYYSVSVADNGIGFHSKDAEKIFNLFTRLHQSANDYHGTGIGLSIVRKVLENHTGYIFADSEPGKGSVFTLLFPVD
jgi:signal transduction histidine kinase